MKDENGNVVTHQTRSSKEEATLVKGSRKPFDEGRPTGSVENHTDMDYMVSAAEIIRDLAANAHMTKDEQIAFANSDANFNEMDSSLNRSKGDKSMTDWLDNPNSSGQKPDEIFDISAEDEAKLRQKDAEAREEYEKQKKEAEQKSIEAGKKSRKEEAFRIGGKALRAVLIQLLAELVREIIAKLVKWFKAFYLLYNKKTKTFEVVHKGKDVEDKFKTEINESSKEVIIAQDEPVYEYVKSSAIRSMYSRHEGVATIMSDSVDAIRENIKVPESTNDEIDEISAELDKMISED